jgi:Holliday junction resolvasome RuvABC ATP-dependent DNA helicase subunit
MLANDGTFTTLVTDSVSASNVITDRITSRKATLDSLETGSLATTAMTSRALVETMDVVDVHENIVTRELTSTAISSVVVKAESINSMDCRVASLVVDDLSGRNIVANDIVSHGNIHSQTLNVTSVQVVLSRREPYPVHPKYGCITWIVCAPLTWVALDVAW